MGRVLVFGALTIGAMLVLWDDRLPQTQLSTDGLAAENNGTSAGADINQDM